MWSAVSPRDRQELLAEVKDCGMCPLVDEVVEHHPHYVKAHYVKAERMAGLAGELDRLRGRRAAGVQVALPDL
jgi:hypothetical protein